MIARARVYLDGKISLDVDKPQDLAVLAFVADVEAEGGYPDALLDRLARAKDALPPSGRALLLHALALGHGDPAIRSDLARSLEAVLRIDGAAARAATPEGETYDALLDSDTRTTALILRAFVASNPDHPLVSRLAAGVLEGRRGGRFRTTQEAAWALLALDALRRAHPLPANVVEGRVYLGETLFAGIEPRSVTAMSFNLPAARLLAGEPLTFAASGGGTLHYHARLRFARRAAPRWIRSRRGSSCRGRCDRSTWAAAVQASPARFTAGDLVQVEIAVATPSPCAASWRSRRRCRAGSEQADADLRQGARGSARSSRGRSAGASCATTGWCTSSTTCPRG